MRFCKLVIGVKPQKRLFRVTSLSGEIVDAVMDVVGSRSLPDDFFTRVYRSGDGSFVRLTDAQEKGINTVSVDTDSIIFTKDHYDKGGRIDFEEVLREFQVIWQACNAVLRIKDVRRIGMVGEYRLQPSTAPSTALLSNLTTFQAKGTAAKFQMQFESHSLTSADSGLPDVKTSDFWNTIESYYDSVLDADHSEEGQITVMIDVQRYYMPLLNGSVPDEVRKLKRRYDDVVRQMKDRPAIRTLDREHREQHVEQEE